MSVRADPLRNTLDHLALDPSAKDDRKYLVSMLRRLGYSDAEIKEALGMSGEGSRVIELEYRKGRVSGAGAFSVVDEGDEQVGFTVASGDAPATFTQRPRGAASVEFAETALDPAVKHGWIPLDGDRSEHGVDIDNPWQTDESEWTTEEEPDADAWVDAPAVAEEEAPVEFVERTQGEAAAWPEQNAPEAETLEAPETLEVDEPETWEAAEAEVAWPEQGDATEPDTEAAWMPEADDASEWVDESASEATEWTASPDYQVTDAPGDAWQATEPVEEDWAPEAEEISAAEHAVDDMEAFTFGEFRLYTRMVELSTGRQQRIYFFAKSEPKSGAPCALPEGYVVEENLTTGLPFLRRDAAVRDEAKAAPAAAAPKPTAEATPQHCLGITKAGNQCKKSPLEGSTYCNIHKGRA